MKTTALTLVLAAFLTLSSKAASPDKITETVRKEIKYPDFAKEAKLEGVVLVSFLVDGGGLISIEQTNSSNEELRGYVVEKLKNLVLNNTDKSESKYNMKFVFQLK